MTDAEIHWRNIEFASDASSRALLLSGLVALIAVASGLVVLSWIIQDVLFVGTGLAVDVIKWPFQQILSYRSRHPQRQKYTAVLDDDDDDFAYLLKSEVESEDGHTSKIQLRKQATLKRAFAYFAISSVLIYPAVLTAIRPDESSLKFLSWTSALLPLVDFSSFLPNLDELKPFYGNGINYDWDNRTALADTVPFSWLSPETKTQGFDDWYSAKQHYNASLDPLKISNLDSMLIPGLRDKLKDIDIRNVVLLFLESTRKDVFPLKKDGMIWNKLENSFADRKLPDHAQQFLTTLTSNANFLTGDYSDGLHHTTTKQRGGINFNNVYTTASYTLKSLTGTLCGITPLAADFNHEYNHHIYQPCLAQIFDALNKAENNSNAQDKDDFTSYKWHSNFMLSVTVNFDNSDLLLSSLGYEPHDVVSREYLRSEAAKFGRVNLPDISYFGMKEDPLEDYIRDSFASARKNNERVFLSHLTSTSHHPFAMPESEEYVPVADGLDDLSKYINTIGYDDRWLGKILDILDEQDAANDTLVVVVGDHGISVPENEIAATYYNPNVGNLRVPLVISHPQLPVINVEDPVASSQILPTILDLLLETGSLSESHKKAVGDLIANYEGQSLLREQKMSTETGQGNWQFTIITPGRAMLSVRDARQPDLRLVVPVVENIEWRFTNTKLDPEEEHPILGFDFASFLQNVEDIHGRHIALWAEEAAFISRWWVEENSRRWRFGPYAE
ncbi:hypothetical protein QQS21_000961 [Conoideocrella luteorostrata]|uniref:Sulfatase N-terminal domain-containing protein n=1 Tax=Conoideocrella luteorostrata TaxID=1105319 RepID=A0AAJ0FY17_9HYPO|nr:hypothetical protein QQS21_000961 [Conoideocrella luteorostrata]